MNQDINTMEAIKMILTNSDNREIRISQTKTTFTVMIMTHSGPDTFQADTIEGCLSKYVECLKVRAEKKIETTRKEIEQAEKEIERSRENHLKAIEEAEKINEINILPPTLLH